METLNPQFTFYPGFLLVCEMLCPCPDDHVYIIHAEDLKKTSRHTCFQEQTPEKSPEQHRGDNYREKSLWTFASNPLMNSDFSVLHPQIPDLFLWRPKPN